MAMDFAGPEYRAFIDAFYNSLPLELRTKVYDEVFDGELCESIASTSIWGNAKAKVQKSELLSFMDAKVVGTDVAQETVAHFFSSVTFKINGTQNIRKVLNRDVFRAGVKPSHATLTSVTVRTHINEHWPKWGPLKLGAVEEDWGPLLCDQQTLKKNFKLEINFMICWLPSDGEEACSLLLDIIKAYRPIVRHAFSRTRNVSMCMVLKKKKIPVVDGINDSDEEWREKLLRIFSKATK